MVSPDNPNGEHWYGSLRRALVEAYTWIMFIGALISRWFRSQEEKRKDILRQELAMEISSLGSSLSDCRDDSKGRSQKDVINHLKKMHGLLREIKGASKPSSPAPSTPSSLHRDSYGGTSLHASSTRSPSIVSSSSPLLRTHSLGPSTAVSGFMSPLCTSQVMISPRFASTGINVTTPRADNVSIVCPRPRQYASPVHSPCLSVPGRSRSEDKAPHKSPLCSASRGRNNAGGERGSAVGAVGDWAEPKRVDASESYAGIGDIQVGQQAKGGRGQQREGGSVHALLSGARHNRICVVEAILEEGTIDIDVVDEHGNTALMLACQNGNKRIAKACLRRGAKLNLTNKRGLSPLDFCRMFGYAKLAAYLEEKGARHSRCERDTSAEGFHTREDADDEKEECAYTVGDGHCAQRAAGRLGVCHGDRGRMWDSEDEEDGRDDRWRVWEHAEDAVRVLTFGGVVSDKRGGWSEGLDDCASMASTRCGEGRGDV